MILSLMKQRNFNYTRENFLSLLKIVFKIFVCIYERETSSTSSSDDVRGRTPSVMPSSLNHSITRFTHITHSLSFTSLSLEMLFRMTNVRHFTSLVGKDMFALRKC